MVDADLLAAFQSERTPTASPASEAELTTGLRSFLEQARRHGLPQSDAHAFVTSLCGGL